MNRILITVAFCTFLSAACNKSNDKPDCLITKISQTSAEDYILSYDEKGRLKSVNYGDDSHSSITYEENKIISVSTSISGYYRKSTYTLNSAGLVTQLKNEFNEAGTSWQLIVYQYQGNQVSGTTFTESGGSGSTRTNTWSNGNLIKEVISRPGFTQKFEYEYYTDKPYHSGYRADEPIIIEKSKNLLKKYTSTVTESGSSWSEITGYTYEFDKEGKVISMTEKDEQDNTRTPVVYKFEYKCN